MVTIIKPGNAGKMDKIQGHKMTDIESKLATMCESDRAFQRVAKAVEVLQALDLNYKERIHNE